MSKTWGILFGGSGHGPDSSCQISAYYKFFSGKSYFYRTTGNVCKLRKLHRLLNSCSLGWFGWESNSRTREPMLVLER